MQSSIPIDAIQPHHSSARVFSLLLILGLLVTVPGRAQATKAESNTDDSDVYIEEIIVTAQRRERPLQDVPISISVFANAEIESLKGDILGRDEKIALLEGKDIEIAALQDQVAELKDEVDGRSRLSGPVNIKRLEVEYPVLLDRARPGEIVIFDCSNTSAVFLRNQTLREHRVKIKRQVH